MYRDSSYALTSPGPAPKHLVSASIAHLQGGRYVVPRFETFKGCKLVHRNMEGEVVVDWEPELKVVADWETDWELIAD